jgi:hypothetical protein
MAALRDSYPISQASYREQATKSISLHLVVAQTSTGSCLTVFTAITLAVFRIATQ